MWEINDKGFPDAIDNSKYNMLPIVVDLQNVIFFDGGLTSPFQIPLLRSDGSQYSFFSAQQIIEALKELMKSKLANKKLYLIIVGGHEIIPHGIFHGHYYH